MSAQNSCISVRNSWIPPVSTVSSLGCVALVKALEFIACPEERGKFQGLRERERERERRGRAEPDSTPKMYSPAQILINLVH